MKSLQAFEQNLKSTDLFTSRIHAMSTYLKPKKVEDYPKTIPIEALNFAMFDDTHFEKIFELGFIAIFANFEHFMYEFLKELYTKQLKAIPAEKTIKAEDLFEFKNYRSVREYLIDSVAVENSYDIETWNNTIKRLFNFSPLSDDVKLRLMIMNSMRNMLMHSGGQWNSKIYRDIKKIDKAFNFAGKEVSETKVSAKFRTTKSALTPDIAYGVTIECFHQIIKDIKSQIEKKKNRKKKPTG